MKDDNTKLGEELVDIDEQGNSVVKKEEKINKKSYNKFIFCFILVFVVLGAFIFFFTINV